MVGQFKSASILFADMVGFTPLSIVLSPEEMVEVLNDIFSTFDAIVEQHGLERIRIIGDEYMAAAGVPRPRPNHTAAAANAALDMLAYVNNLPAYAGTQIKFRFGINSGPVTAAMIGRSNLQYDIWGDAVNIASRMESHGLPGKIQVTRDVYDLLVDQFICESRGSIPVKGKGQMQTWFLVGRKY
jgi:guanylate cyclase